MNNNLLEKYQLMQVSRELNFSVGDTVRVHYKIKEAGKERIQIFEGLVLGMQNKISGKSFTVRRVSYDVGVERIFPLYSPLIDKVEKLRSSKVRRCKLYYLRDKSGKDGRLKEIKKTPAKDLVWARKQALNA